MCLCALAPILALASLVPSAGAPAGPDLPVLTLEEAIRTARRNNPSFLAAREKVLQAAQWRRKALAPFLPTWTAAGTYTRFNKEVSFDYPDISSFEYDPFASPPFSFSRYEETVIQKANSFGANTTLNLNLLNMSLFPRYSAVGDQVRAAELTNQAYENEFIYGVVSSYYAALGAKKVLAVAREGLEVARGHHRAAKAKFEAGELPRLAYLRAEIEAERAEQDLRKAGNAFANAREALAVLLDGGAEFDVAEAADVPGPPAVQAAELYDEALGARTDIAAAAAAVQAAEKGKREVWYRFFPTLQASGTMRYSDMLGFIGDDYQWFVIFSLSVTLYDGGLRYADLGEKSSALSEAELNLRAAKSSLRGQLRQALLENDTCRANMSSAVRQVELGRESYRVAKANFDLGLATPLEVTDANATLNTAQLNLAREELGCQLARLKVLKVLGTMRTHYR